MSCRTGKAAYIEDYDEGLQGVVPDTRQSATCNTAAKITRLDRFHEPHIDGSDSGYSSRATVISSQSDPSGGKYPHKRDLPKTDDRKSSLRNRDRPRTAHDETMPYGPFAPQYAQVPRTSSKSRRREQHLRPYPPVYYDQHYQPSSQADGPSDYPPFQPPPIPQPRGHRYDSDYITEYHSSGRPRSMYRYVPEPQRPISWAQYPPYPYPYDHPPPPFSSAWNNFPDTYAPPQHYAASEYAPEYPRERSQSHARAQTRTRRGSYAQHVESDPSVTIDDYYDEDDPEQYYQEAPRRSKYDDYDELPPPPPLAPSRPSKSAAKVHQAKRASSVMPTQRRSSRAADSGRPLDMSSIRDALPETKTRRTSRESRPERVSSLRESQRSQSYHDSARGQVVVETPTRRRKQQQHYQPDSQASIDLEDREREIEDYQAARNSHSTAVTPLSSETFLGKETGSGSDRGSQKSRSNSSRASGASKAEKDMRLMVGGVAMSFMESELQGKSISITADDSGDMRLDISKGRHRAPKKYLPSSGGSDYTDAPSRREEDPRRRREARSTRTTGSRRGQYN